MGQGQLQVPWCTEAVASAHDLVVPFARSPKGQASGSSFAADPPPDAAWLLQGCPRELAEVLQQTGQLEAFRCRPWLSPGAFRSLQRSLRRCGLRQMADKFRESEAADEGSYALPQVIPWSDLDMDHVINAGQVFRIEDVERPKLQQLRRIGMHTLRQGKVGVVLLAGGANFRISGADAPVGCSRGMLKLRSGKSIIQLLCERVRRMATLCSQREPARPHVSAKTEAAMEIIGGLSSPQAEGKRQEQQQPQQGPLPSIPVFVMVSRLTRRTVVEHFEANNYFGLPSRDVAFFEQGMYPVVSDSGRLMPQSLGGEFAMAPGGTGEVLKALAGSTVLEQMQDRGVECLHMLGTENLLARVCDPAFIGFCRDLELDCAAKVVERLDPNEDLDLFAVRQSPVSTQYADVEEAASGLPPSEAPENILNMRNKSGVLSYAGSINSFFFAVSYIEEATGRSVKPHRIPREVPYLDFYVEGSETESTGQEEDAEAQQQASKLAESLAKSAPVPMGCWPPEALTTDFACQRALLAAAMEVRAQRALGKEDTEAMAPPLPHSHCSRLSPADDARPALEAHTVSRCDVQLDPLGPLAVVRVRTAADGPAERPSSICSSLGHQVVSNALVPLRPLSCSLVVPRRPNAYVFESLILDCFAFTDRAVALQVLREREFSAVREVEGPFGPVSARKALSSLHFAWVLAAGANIEMISDSQENAHLEVSPLLSYEGEGLTQALAGQRVERLPCHFTGLGEVDCSILPATPTNGEQAAAAHDETTAPDGADPSEAYDTRPFYLQEYARRPEISGSHEPRFKPRHLGSSGASPRGDSPSPSQPSSASRPHSPAAGLQEQQQSRQSSRCAPSALI